MYWIHQRLVGKPSPGEFWGHCLSKSGRKIEWVQCAKYVGIKQLKMSDSITANNGQKFNLVNFMI